VLSRVYFDPTTGQMLAMEFCPQDDVDPCELHFSQYAEVDGRQFPMRIEVRHGDRPPLEFTFERVNLATADE